MRILMTVALLAATAGVVQASADEIVWAKDGVARAAIVVAERPDKAARYGAEDLKRHLDKMTGCDFRLLTDAEYAKLAEKPYPICVGESKLTKAKRLDFGCQEWLVDVQADKAEFVGFDKDDDASGVPKVFDAQSSMYAVYDFLENDLGVVWADPSDYGTYIPNRPTLVVKPTARRGKPFIAFRGGGRFKNDSFTPCLWKGGTPEEKKYEELAFARSKNKKQATQLFLRRHRVGGQEAHASHSFGWMYEPYWEKGGKKFVEYHPEYFARGYGDPPPQMCFSDERFVAKTVQDIRDYFDKGGYQTVYSSISRGYHWGEDCYSLEPSDNCSFCKCPACTAQYEPNREKEWAQHSTYWFRFVNRVAKEIRKSHPTKRINTLAYFSHEGVPTDMEMEDNVTVYFCLSANREPFVDLFGAQKRRMREWRARYPNLRMAVWFYNCFPKLNADVEGFRCFPGFFADAAREQFHFLKEMNATDGIFYDGVGEQVDSYLAMEWMMNPEKDTEELLNRHFLTYGKAGPYLKEFYRTVERRYCDASLYPKGTTHQSVKLAWGVLGTPEVMAKLGELMAKAEAAADTPDDQAHVAIWKHNIWDYMKGGFDTFQLRSACPCPKWNVPRIASAGGDAAKVDWSKVPCVDAPAYEMGSQTVGMPKEDVRLAHDGEYFYLEIVEHCDPKKLKIRGHVSAYDNWEMLFARQEAQPYRYYISVPDAYVTCLSYGEVNFRQGVRASESGDPTFGMKLTTDLTQTDRWTTRWAFPMASLVDKPVKPGDTVYFNGTRVMGEALCGKPRIGIYTFCPFTTVHTIDRAVSLTFEK